MPKDPAFLFYSSDFLTGVQDLTMEERGQYITLLCIHHQKGRLTQKMVQLACHGNATADVLAKFRQDEHGLYYHPRLEEEAEKRRAHGEKQRQRASKRWNKENTDTTANAAASPTAMPFLENENENEVVSRKGGLGGELSATEIGATIEFIAITGQRRLTAEQVVEYWKAYLIHSQGEFHHGRNKQLQHFRNWLKKQPNGTTKTPIAGKSSGAIKLAASLAADLQSRNV